MAKISYIITKRHHMTSQPTISDNEERGELAARIIPLPKDTNGNGDIFGGWIMAQMDLAGSMPAYRRAAGKVVTVAVDKFLFLKPVLVGDIVSCYCLITKIGNTSLKVRINTYSERHGIGEFKVAEADITYVAITDKGKPRPVPQSE